MRIGVLIAMVALAGVCLADPTDAAAVARKPTSLPAQNLELALQSFVQQRKLQIIFRSAIVKDLRSPAIEGNFSDEEVLQQLLAGSGLTYHFLDEKTVTISKEVIGSTQGSAGELPTLDEEREFLSRHADESSNNAAETAERRRVRLSETSTGTSEDAQGDSSPAKIEEIVVTAQKRTQSLLDVPFSVTALDAQALERAGVTTIQSLSYSVPSLVVQETGSGFQQYFIRGVSNGNSSSSLVGVYLDEADITSNSNSQLDLRAVDLERVEVLKGPQGTLYGAGSAGGTIRFITRDPQLQRFGASGNLKFSSTRDGDPSTELSGVLNLPLVEDKLGLRLVGTFADLGGWIDQPAASRSDINNQDLRELRVKGLWKPSEQASVKAMAIIRRNEGDGSNASADEHNDLDLPTDPAGRTPFSSDFDIFNVTASYDFANASLLSSSTYSDTRTSGVIGLRYIFDPPPAELFEFLNAPDDRDARSASQEIRLSSVGDGSLHWVTGVFYKDLSIDYTTHYVFGQGDEVFGTGVLQKDETSKSTSFFADASYALTPRTEVGVGARYFHDKRTIFDGEASRGGSFHSFDPRIYASFAARPNVHFYANVADGFRSGGFNDTSGLPETAYDPEKVRSYEIGTKLALLDRRLSAEFALFYSDYDEIQVFRITPTGIGSLSNAGNAELKGFDWTLDFQATEHLLLSFSGNVTDSEYVDLQSGVFTVQKGDPLDFSTEYSGHVAATYAFNLADTPVFARVDFNRVGPSHTTDRSGPYPILYQTDVIDMLNVRCGFDRGAWSFELFGNNLTDDNGVQDASGAFGFGSRPRPRTVGIEVRATFD